MSPRLNHHAHLPDQLQLLTQIETQLADSDLTPQLLELVKLRVSQINGCSFCVRLHTQCLRRLQVDDELIDLVAVWPEAPCFSEREQTALQWAEAVTRLPDAAGIPDAQYARMVAEFGEKSGSQLTLAIGMINLWNRLAVPFQTDHRFVDQLLATMV